MTQRKTGKAFKSAAALLLTVLLAVVCAQLISRFVVGSYFVDGYSMEPNYSNGQKLYGLKTGKPLRGRVVVIRVDGFKIGSVKEEELLLKRVVGLEGDILWSEDGVLCRIRNGSVEVERFEKESYSGKVLSKMDVPVERITVKQGFCFVLGDNRTGNNSLDSRILGQISLKDIVAVIPFS